LSVSLKTRRDLVDAGVEKLWIWSRPLRGVADDRHRVHEVRLVFNETDKDGLLKSSPRRRAEVKAQLYFEERPGFAGA